MSCEPVTHKDVCLVRFGVIRNVFIGLLLRHAFLIAAYFKITLFPETHSVSLSSTYINGLKGKKTVSLAGKQQGLMAQCDSNSF